MAQLFKHPSGVSTPNDDYAQGNAEEDGDHQEEDDNCLEGAL